MRRASQSVLADWRAMDKKKRSDRAESESSPEDSDNVLTPTGRNLEGERSKTEAAGSLGRDTTGQARRSGRQAEDDLERERAEPRGISNKDLEGEDWEDPSLAGEDDVGDEEDV